MFRHIYQYLKPIALDGLYLFFPGQYKKLIFKRYDRLNRQSRRLGALEAELLLLRYFLQRESVFFDVGANMGEYVYMAGKYAAPENIYAFEPIPDLYRRLRYLFRQTHIFQTALSDRKGAFSFKIPIIGGKSFATRSTLNVDYVEEGENDATIMEVRTECLDDFVAEQSLRRLDLIKIDVEGHEERVIAGARHTIERLKPTLIVEIAQKHHDQPIRHVIRSIEAAGYACYYFDETLPGLRALQTDPAALQSPPAGLAPVYNFVFLPHAIGPEQKAAQINQSLAAETSA